MAWTAPDVFRFRDYRAFLRAFYALNKAGEYGFSLRAFSKRAQLRSSNYLKLVMDGERNLTQEMAARFAEACSLRGQSAEYFCALVAFDQADTAKDRDRAYARVSKFKRYRAVHRLDRAQDAYHAHWYMPAIRELVVRRDFREDSSWLAQQLRPAITPREAERALQVLLELGLLTRNAEGQLEQVDALVQTPETPLSHHIQRYHRAMMERAADAMHEVPHQQRQIESITLCLSESRMRDLKARVESFCDEVLQEYQADADSRRVVQLNIQMFPLTIDEG
ncbi:MAG TPA: TIGR02147 family protein [Polyangiales bacterium]|nr:TIGR02147 family protein [Polyangiales bacterium]